MAQGQTGTRRISQTTGLENLEKLVGLTGGNYSEVSRSLGMASNTTLSWKHRGQMPVWADQLCVFKIAELERMEEACACTQICLLTGASEDIEAATPFLERLNLKVTPVALP